MPVILRTPHAFISDNNSIPFVNRIRHNNTGNLKNDSNTLSCESFARNQKLAYTEFELFQSNHKITTQIESNYSQIIVKVIKNGVSFDSGNTIPITKRTNFIGLEDKRDAIRYDLTNGKTGIYFDSGNTYDYGTSNINGTYDLGGKLPEFAYSSNYVSFGGNWHLIENVFYDEEKRVYAIIIDDVFVGADETIQISSIYDLNNYETYDFVIDMVDYLDTNIKVTVDFIDPDFSSLKSESEFLTIKRSYKKSVELRYKSKENNDINYSFGQENRMILHVDRIDGNVDGEVDNYNTDNSTIQTKAIVRRYNKYKFDPMTKGKMYRVIEALMHDIVYINNMPHVCSAVPETSEAENDSNLYVVTAIMIVARNLTGKELAETPSFIEGNNAGILKYIGY